MGFSKKQNVLGPVDPETAAEWARTIAAWSPEERKRKEKALVRHIDRRLLPMLVCIALLCSRIVELKVIDPHVHLELC